jgi:acetolactate decarboxylase
MKLLFVALVSLLFTFPPPVEVKVAGEMKKIMRQGNLSAHLSLDTLLTQPNVYGLGPAEGIKGELLILDSKAYWCRKENDKLTTSVSNNTKAAMLVYARVPAWKEITITDDITSYTSLEKAVEKFAAQNGQPLDKPFPFIVKGAISKASWHVIDWKDGITHTFENHKQFAEYGNFNQEPVALLGFYSDKHHSIFTHHTTNMHVHIMNENKTVVGHLEEINSQAGKLILSIPDNK